MFTAAFNDGVFNNRAIATVIEATIGNYKILRHSVFNAEVVILIAFLIIHVDTVDNGSTAVNLQRSISGNGKVGIH